MTVWKWLRADTAEAVHDEQLAEFGGGEGTRDSGALLSALARPQNLAAYGAPDAPDLAAAYAYGVAKNHPFVDGNKRTAWVLARLFLHKNGISLAYRDAEAVLAIYQVAAGELSEEQLANWFRERIA
ncbi:MAG TPA: type II toxin-antitoxin system death-on-curing family toxin [Sphingomicrobium sp.]